MATTQNKTFCVCEFIKIESATAVQRAFRLRFNIQPPTRKNICCWNHQFEQIGCMCKGKKSSGRPRVSEENVRRGCRVAILLSTDAAARLCARTSALAVVFENLGPPLSNVMYIIHIPCIVQEI